LLAASLTSSIVLTLLIPCRYDQYEQEEVDGGDEVDEAADEEAEGDDAAEAQGDDAAEAQGDDAAAGERRLQNKQYVNCDTCNNMGCWKNMNDNGNNNNQNEQVTMDDIVDWVEQMSECQEAGVQWNDMDLYSTFMCNGDGTGVEIGIFLDDECTLYSSVSSYADLFPNSAYMYNSLNIVTYPFVEDISCAAEIEWDSPEEAANDQDGEDEDENENNNDEEAEPNEFCQGLIESDFVLPLENCALNGGGDENDDNADEEEEQGDYYSYFSNFNYDISQEDMESSYSVCVALNTFESSGEGGLSGKAQNNVFKSDVNVYDYSKASTTSVSLDTDKIVGITLIVLGSVAIIGWVGYKCSKQLSDYNPKLTPLV
jgi:hypothetical protein